MKTELVLCYLANISVPDYQIRASHLFDSEELSFLAEHKDKFIKHEKECEEMIQGIQKHEFDIPELHMRGGPSDSLFCALDSPRSIDEGRGKLGSDEGRGKSSLTMKIMQLELDQNKKVEMISELK